MYIHKYAFTSFYLLTIIECSLKIYFKRCAHTTRIILRTQMYKIINLKQNKNCKICSTKFSRFLLHEEQL